MGEAAAESPQVPQLSLSVAKCRNRADLGPEPVITSLLLDRLNPNDIREPQRASYSSVSFLSTDPLRNRQYEEEVVNFVWHNALFTPISLAVRNDAAVSADDVIEFDFPFSDSAHILDVERYPEEPSRSIALLSDRVHNLTKRRPDTAIKAVEDNRWRARAAIPRIRPGATEYTASPLYLGATAEQAVQVEATLYCHNVSPKKLPLTVNFRLERRPMTLADVRLYIDHLRGDVGA